MVLAAYRHILRSTRIAFHGDLRMLSAARHTARSKFDANRSLLPGSAEAENAREHAEKVATILKKNIVQGQQVGGEVEKYQLRIHDETERGDNETIRTGGKVVAATGECCGGR